MTTQLPAPHKCTALNGYSLYMTKTAKQRLADPLIVDLEFLARVHRAVRNFAMSGPSRQDPRGFCGFTNWGLGHTTPVGLYYDDIHMEIIIYTFGDAFPLFRPELREEFLPHFERFELDLGFH